jgi:hypothetical protein
MLLMGFLTVMPAVMAVYMLTLTRLEILYAEAQRRQIRAQARLLAESALAQLATHAQSADSARATGIVLEGEIEGVGAYGVERGATEHGSTVYYAVGQTQDLHGGVRPTATESRIIVRRTDGVGNWEVLESSFGRDASNLD